MVTINLLPWRNYDRAYQERWTKKLILISIIVTLLMTYFAHFYVSKHIMIRQKQVIKLQEKVDNYMEIKRFFQNKKAGFNREKLTKNQINNHQFMQNFFKELGKKTMAEVCFTEIMREKNVISFSGNAHTAVDLTAFLKQWNAASLFSEIMIEELNYVPNNHQMHFRFQAK